MSFAFGFVGDDVESDEDPQTETNDLVSRIEKIQVHETKPLISPALHSLPELLSALPSQISYNLLHIPSVARPERTETVGDDRAGSALYVARRSIFDIRAQLMVEADPDENDNESLLGGLDSGDLSTGIYEGGFKTWECAVDLASLVADIEFEDGLHIIELGAGSAIPSLTLLQKTSRLQQDASRRRRIHFTLCDYNEDVLRLATAPNVFLAQQPLTPVAAGGGGGPQFQGDDVEDIDEAKISRTLDSLQVASAEFSFISGAWSPELVHLVETAISTSATHQARGSSRTIILASETIYSPESTQIFTETVMQLLRRDPVHSTAWVAAKKIYFGVGGGTQDFEHEVIRQGGSLRTLLDVQSAGVGRVVLEVTVAANG